MDVANSIRGQGERIVTATIRICTSPITPVVIGLAAAWILPVLSQAFLPSLVNKLHTIFYIFVTLGTFYVVRMVFPFPDTYELYLPLLLSLGAFLGGISLPVAVEFVRYLYQACGLEPRSDGLDEEAGRELDVPPRNSSRRGEGPPSGQ
ncbi:hypothetical protein ABW19_dt0200130 [Dactylella cylindrospora]|nr:hypothetical protein ABW19_dt0200130 [Dactylella cylindrospora]